MWHLPDGDLCRHQSDPVQPKTTLNPENVILGARLGGKTSVKMRIVEHSAALAILAASWLKAY